MHTELGALISLRLCSQNLRCVGITRWGSFKHSWPGPTPESLRQVCLGHEGLNFYQAPSDTALLIQDSVLRTPALSAPAVELGVPFPR